MLIYIVTYRSSLLSVYNLLWSCAVAGNVALLRVYFAHFTDVDWSSGFSVSGTLVANIMTRLAPFLHIICYQKIILPHLPQQYSGTNTALLKQKENSKKCTRIFFYVTAIGCFKPIQLILNVLQDLNPFNLKINGGIAVPIMRWLNHLR